MSDLREFAHYKVLIEDIVPKTNIGDVVGMNTELGDQWAQFGILCPSTETGDLIDPNNRIVWQVAIEKSGEIVRVGKDQEIAKPLPNGKIDLNPDAKTPKDLDESQPKITTAAATK